MNTFDLLDSLGYEFEPMVLPSHVFFTPTVEFLDWIAHKKYGIIDVGAGVGRFQMMMMKRHPTKSMASIDLNTRDRLEWPVPLADGRKFPYKPNMVVTVCRPDHSGWAECAIKKAHKDGVKELLYVGLERNVKHDLDIFKYRRVFDKAGFEGEHCWKITGVKQ